MEKNESIKRYSYATVATGSVLGVVTAFLLVYPDGNTELEQTTKVLTIAALLAILIYHTIAGGEFCSACLRRSSSVSIVLTAVKVTALWGVMVSVWLSWKFGLLFFTVAIMIAILVIIICNIIAIKAARN